MSTVLITGASRGIGRATARLFAQDGYNVIINYNKSEKEALSLETEINAAYPARRAAALRADVSDEAQVRAMFESAATLFSPVDILVNNAGVAWQGLLTDMSTEAWDTLFTVNVRSAFLCARAALPHMVSRQEGCIVNVSSIWGIAGASCEVAYSASKAALIGLTKALAQEVGPSGVRVNCVAPGVIDTDMNKQLDAACMEGLKAQTPLGFIGSAEDAAHAILFLASQRAAYITGQTISPNGGFVL